MTDLSTNLMLPYIAAAQAQKHIPHNEALEKLDALVQLTLQSEAQTIPPVSPDAGHVWAIGTGAVNEWAGQDGKLALWSNGGWVFFTPRVGWLASLGAEIRIWTGSAWVPAELPPLQNLPGLGVNTSYDGTNTLAVSGDASLLTHDGSGHQLKINKATATDTAAVLFQTGYSGRAEMGTLGDDEFGLKVSADGSTWQTALSVAPSTGAVRLAQALSPDHGGTGVANDAAATLTRNGAHALTVTTTAASSVTLPTSGTLATVAGTETLSNKTLSDPIVTGTITGTAVTQSRTDRTSGRVMKTGDFGLSETMTLAATDHLDDVIEAGWYYNSTGGNTPGNNYPTGSAGYLHVIRASSLRIIQLYYPYLDNSSSTQHALYLRGKGTNGWSVWSKMPSSRSLVGAVSQTGGIPTGDVFERGSNANGAYLRCADGTQICWIKPAAVDAQTGIGNLFMHSALLSWTFPASFANSSIAVSGDAGNAGRWIGASATGATGAVYRVYSATSSATLSQPNLTAIGRWF